MSTFKCLLQKLYTLNGKHFWEEHKENMIPTDPWLKREILWQSEKKVSPNKSIINAHIYYCRDDFFSFLTDFSYFSVKKNLKVVGNCQSSLKMTFWKGCRWLSYSIFLTRISPVIVLYILYLSAKKARPTKVDKCLYLITSELMVSKWLLL